MDWQSPSPPPVVRLTRYFENPVGNAVATARTCYSGGGIVVDEDCSPKDITFAGSLYQAGHHTIFQHAHFQFALEGVSRQAIWSLLHAHPFYNSEQVSQRYVPVEPGNCFVPALPQSLSESYRATLEMQMRAYQQLTDLLFPLAERVYCERFHVKQTPTVRQQKAIRKKAMEIARYVLPVATTAYLYHTISGLTLLRYVRMAAQGEASTELVYLVNQMVEAIAAVAPEFSQLLEETTSGANPPLQPDHPNPLETTELQRAREFCHAFDSDLGGSYSLLVDWSDRAQTILASAVREVLGVPSGQLPDDQAIALALAVDQNPLLGDALNLTTMGKLTRPLHHVHYVFRKRISHCADSQNQRHRMTPASRPVLERHYTGQVDVICPPLVQQDPQAKDLFDQAMDQTWQAINQLLSAGVSSEKALYLLPNATALRFSESTDLLNLRHKHAMRLCWNAQEEIWCAAVEEKQQIEKIHPLIAEALAPPCRHRYLAGKKPTCPEGERYCGIRAWTGEPFPEQRLL